MHPMAVADGAALVVSARGGLAPGSTAALTTRTTGEQKTAGLSAGWCAPPAASWWFTGVDTSVGSTSRLSLTNVSRAPAVIDIAFFGRRGRIEAQGSRGIGIPGKSQRTIDLAGFAPGADALTVHLSAERGMVSAAVQTFATSGVTPVGTDWIAPAATPSSHLVVGPTAAGEAQQRLMLTNPGRREALAAILVFDPTGGFTATRLKSLRVAPGAVVVRDVTRILEGRPAAVAVSSNVGLTAAMSTIERGQAPPDFATVGASAPLTAPAVVPLPGSTERELLLTTAGRSGATVRVAMFDRTGDRVRSTRIEVEGRTTFAMGLRRRSAVAYLVVWPVHGAPVHAVAWYRNGDGLAALPAVSGEWSTRLPVVTPAQ